MKINPLNSFVIISLIVVLNYFLGILYFLTDVRDFCEMTYMFEYPQFVKIQEDIHVAHPKYGLYAYSEGKLTAKTRNMHFDGIPVIFVPGSSGSYKQVRSVSSVALRKSLNSRLSYHFDYFTLDLNEDITGIYSGPLHNQLEYLNKSVYRVLGLYKQRVKFPERVVIIGHSMGGLLALKFVSLLPTDSNLVPVVITMAAPVLKPAIILDYRMSDFYKFEGMPLSTVLVNIAGGFSDFLIPTYLTASQQNNSVNTVVTHLPRCWLETNHNQIVWCKQLILLINRALFDSVDLNTLQISLDVDYIKSVFHHHFIHHSGINVRQKHMYSSMAQIYHKGEWIENLPRQYSIYEMRGLRQPKSYMVSITQLPNYKELTVLAINLEQRDWIYACNAAYSQSHNKVCKEALHLTPLSYIAPSVRFRRRKIVIDMHDLKRNYSALTHVVFKVMPTDDSVAFHVDQYDPSDRQVIVSLPPWYSFEKHTILEQTAEKAIQYILDVPDLTHVVQAYNLFIEPIQCYNDSYHVSASLDVPWAHFSQHGFYTEEQKRPLIVRLLSSRPENSGSAKIVVVLEPTCTYHISIKSSISTSLSHVARYYSPYLIANVAAVVLLTLAAQLETIRKDKQCSIIFIAIKQGIKPFLVLGCVGILSKFLSLIHILPKPDIDHLNELQINFFMLPMLLYFCSIGIIWVFAILFGLSLVALESTIHKLVLKALAKTLSFNVSWSDYLLSFLHKVPFLVALLLVFICFSTCGGLALCLGLVFYFLKLTQMSQDVIEDMVWHVVKNLAEKLKNAFKKKDLKTNNNKQDRLETNVQTLREPSSENIFVGTRHIDNADKEVPLKDELEVKGNVTDNTNDAESIEMSMTEENIIKTNLADKTESEGSSFKGTNNVERETERTESYIEQTIDIVNKDSDQNNVKGNKQKEGQSTEPRSTKNMKSEGFTSHNSIFFHSTLFFIWCIITGLNIPAVLFWAHNYKYSKSLTPDESFLPGLSLSLSAFLLWQVDLPKTNRKYIFHLEVMTSTIAVLSLIYATVSIYRLNYLLVVQFVLTVLHQCFAPTYEDQEGESKDESNIKYEDVKMKLD